uniref:DUF4283 domain-containing protein n=1 Tax=Beta vulgaris subsp. vulgaris TaxID=3555 RepID=F4NCG5_BETVV|nr:hypothetical protein [Beta vulgaris subsp. vulgaris]
MKKRKREKVQKGAKENHETLEIQSKKSIPSSHLILKKSQKKLKRLVRKCADVHFITIILLLSCWCVVIQVQSQTPKKAPIQFKGYSISFSPQKSLYLCFSFPNSTKEYSITSSSDGVSTIRFNELHFCSNPAGDARVLGFRAFNASSFNSSFSEGFNHMCAKVVFQRRNSAKRGVFSDVMSFADCPRNGTKFVSPLNAMELHLSISHFKQISPYYPSIKLLYKRGGKVSYYNTPKSHFSFYSGKFITIILSTSSFKFIMSTPHSFKDMLVGNHNHNSENSETPLVVGQSDSTKKYTSVVESKNPLNESPLPPNNLHDPPVFPETCVLDDLPQVKKDICELSKSCLFGKMLSAPLDIRTIISRTKADWRVVKGDVDYLEMGNGWILLRFANPQDLALVWSERPWHIQGDLLVLQPWKPSFDPYLEEIKWVDLWVRIPRLPTELLNFDSIANLLASNDIGALIKLDQRSLLRNKIRFARACIRVDIQGPLLEFAEVSRSGDLRHGYVIWYEDFSAGCSFCGEIAHLIEACPLLNSPKKEISIQLLKNPKQQALYKTLAKAAGQDSHITTAEPAQVVYVKPKHLSKNHVPLSGFSKEKNARVSDGLLPMPVAKGIVLKESSQNQAKLSPAPVYGKGKGKMVVSDPYESEDSSDDDADFLAPSISPPPMLATGENRGDTDVEVSSLLPLDVAKPLSPLEGSGVNIVQLLSEDTAQIQYSPDHLLDDANNFLLDAGDDVDDLDTLNAYAENSFHSIQSDSSIVKQIQSMGMDASFPVELSSHSSSAKRMIEDHEEDDDASSALKRKRT